MSDTSVIHIAENSPEWVAYKMTLDIIRIVEGKSLQDLSRRDFLDTYAECLRAVNGKRAV